MKTNVYNWEVPRSIPDREPVRPFVLKIPFKMEFLDSINQVFYFNKETGKLEFYFEVFNDNQKRNSN